MGVRSSGVFPCKYRELLVKKEVLWNTQHIYNGLSMPMVGFGVFQIADGSATQTVVEEAIVTDYRLIDTAQGLRHELRWGQASFC